MRPQDVWSSRFEVPASGNGTLDGLRVAVKDLFDVAGHPTLAGRKALLNTAPAASNAAAVQCLLDAGASLVGHTTMSQLAFSGVGQNPDFGRSISPWSPDADGRLAGGSSRGSALAVALGEADIGLGTDTGGSCRIPAACNGLYGFKPTASRVSLQGCTPLSHSLDSVGLMAASCDIGRRAMDVLCSSQPAERPATLEFLVPGFVLDRCDRTVADAFRWALDRLAAAGHCVRHMTLTSEKTYAHLQSMPSLASLEAYGLYGDRRHNGVSDPKVFKRIMVGRYPGSDTVRKIRNDLVGQFSAEVGDAFVLMPTLPWVPPLTEVAESDRYFEEINRDALRNCAFINLAGGCAVAMPLSMQVPVSMTVAAPRMQDERLWAVADYLDRIFSQSDA